MSCGNSVLIKPLTNSQKASLRGLFFAPVRFCKCFYCISFLMLLPISFSFSSFFLFCQYVQAVARLSFSPLILPESQASLDDLFSDSIAGLSLTPAHRKPICFSFWAHSSIRFCLCAIRCGHMTQSTCKVGTMISPPSRLDL